MKCEIERTIPLTPTILQVIINPLEGNFEYQAGQYLNLLTGDRKAAYSIANAPVGSHRLELHIRHTQDNQFSHNLIDQMKRDGTLEIEGPYGKCTAKRIQADKPIIFLAGGTGFAPIKALIEQVLTDNINLPLHLYWGARYKFDIYLDELGLHWKHATKNFRYVPVLSEEKNHHTRKGLVHNAVLGDFDDLTGFQVFAAGPIAMVQAALKDFTARGLKAEDFYSDTFEILQN